MKEQKKRTDLSNWDPFKDYTLGEYNSKDDSEFQEMKVSYEKMTPEEQLEYKNDLYDGMVQDGIIEDGSTPLKPMHKERFLKSMIEHCRKQLDNAIHVIDQMDELHCKEPRCKIKLPDYKYCLFDERLTILSQQAVAEDQRMSIEKLRAKNEEYKTKYAVLKIKLH